MKPTAVFDLFTACANAITPAFAPNPAAGAVHSFDAYRLAGDIDRPVYLATDRGAIAGQSDPPA